MVGVSRMSCGPASSRGGVTAPLLPPKRSDPQGGRPPCLAIFPCTGCPWKALPRSLGAASTVHDRFQEWRRAGVFERMWQAGLLEYMTRRRALIGDGRRWTGPYCWGEKGTGPNPTDRGKSGTKRSLLTEGQGIPIAITVDGANRHNWSKIP